MPPTNDGSKRRPQFNVILPTILPREKPSAKRELAIKLHARREVKDMQDEYASTEHYYTAMSPGHEHLSLAGAFGTELHLQQQAEQRDSQDWMSHRYGTPPGHHDRGHASRLTRPPALPHVNRRSSKNNNTSSKEGSRRGSNHGHSNSHLVRAESSLAPSSVKPGLGLSASQPLIIPNYPSYSSSAVVTGAGFHIHACEE